MFRTINYRTLGFIVKTSREYQNMTQEDLAEKTGLSIPYISDIECGKRNISIDTLALLSKALGIRSDVLIGLDNGEDDYPEYFLKIHTALSEMDCNERELLTEVFLDAVSFLKSNNYTIAHKQ